MRSRIIVGLLLSAGTLALLACGASNPGLNQTSVTCPAGRTLLDGVCVSEPVADYVACVRAQGAQLGGAKHQQLSADVGTVGVKAGAAAEVSESLEKKYAASDSAMLEIVRKCAASFGGAGSVATAESKPSALRSTDTKKPVRLTFVNRRERSVRMVWIDFEGREKDYAELRPGESAPYDTFVQHFWIARELPSGAAVFTFSSPDQAPKNVEIR